MAKVQLHISTEASLKGLQDSQKSLLDLQKTANGVTQTFRNTRDIDGYRALISKAFHEAGLSGKTYAQSVTAARGAALKAFREIQAAIGSGDKIRIYNEKGVKYDEANLKKILKQAREVYDEIVAKYEQMAKGGTKEGETYSYESFDRELTASTKGLGVFGSELDVVNAKIAAIKEQGIRLIDAGATQEEIDKLKVAYDGLVAEQERLNQSTNGTGTRIKNLIKNFVSAQLIVYALRKAFSTLVNGLRESSQAAAEAEQVMQKFMTVFDGMGSAAQSVEDLANQFGLAKSSAMDIMATIGDMAIGLGASDAEAAQFADTTSKFIQDLMAFKDIGGDVVEISKAFMSGVAGNTRNFRQWGSIVKESTVTANLHSRGLDKLTGQELEWAKAQERTRIVMEQQRNALGATQREWDQLVTVNRRYNEQTKQLKENIGETVNKFFLPLKSAIEEQIRLWNDAHDAREAYMEGFYEPMKSEEFWGSTRETTARRQARSDYTGAIQVYSSTWGSSIGKDALNIDPSELERYAREWGIEAKDAAIILEDAGFLITKEAQEMISAFDLSSEIDRQNRENEEAFKAYKQSLEKIVEGISGLVQLAPTSSSNISKAFSMTGATTVAQEQISNIINQLLDKSATDFMDPFDVAIGASDEAGLQERQNQIRAVYGAIHNAELKATDENFKKALKALMSTLVEEYKLTAEEIETLTRKDFLGFDEQNKALIEQLGLQQHRTALLAEYGQENEDIVDILMQQAQAVLGTYDLKQKAIDAGWDEVAAEAARLDIELLILDVYKNQREEREIMKRLEEAAKKDSALQAASDTIAGVRRQRFLVGASPEMQKAAEIDATVAEYQADLERQNIERTKVESMANEYRGELLALSAEEDAQALKEASEAFIGSIYDNFIAQTDIGMVEDIVKAFTEGGMVDGFMAIFNEILPHMEILLDLLNIVSELFAIIGPFIDQVFKPLVPVMDMLFTLLADLIVPALIVLFPAIKFVAIVLIELMAIIKTVTNTISWLGRVINVVIHNISHALAPWKWKAIPNLIDETGEIWRDANAKVEEIWAMELDLRTDFISQLSDTQKAEIKAYEEMYKRGLISLTEKEAMIGKRIFGRNWDSVDIESFGTGGDFITTGPKVIRVGELGPERVTITPMTSPKYVERYGGGQGNTTYIVNVSGATSDPEAIAQAVRREFRIMERRGARYA